MSKFACWALLLIPTVAFAQGKTREEKVREDRAKVEAEGFWIYNDLDRGFAEARRSGKPLLVVLRCIPCEECVKLDDDLLDQDPVIRPLLEEFVCVRQVSTNGLDLSLFQYDTDQSFAVFFLNADRTIYGRFGTRSHRTEWIGDVSLPGLAQALQGALELHAEYPSNQSALAGKRGSAPEYPSPEKFPALKEKYTASLNYDGNVVQSCIHCHQIGDAVRELYRSRDEAIPEHILFPYPHPKAIGLTLDPNERATILEVAAGSHAESAGFKTGDRIAALNGQPLLSTADVQWALHNTSPNGGQVRAEIRRAGSRQQLTLTLPAGWRRSDNISWRVSSWGLRRMATGGLSLEEPTPEERHAAGLSADTNALRVRHVGRYGPHATAKKAGFEVGDMIVAWDGREDFTRESDVLAHGVSKRRSGETIAVTIVRDGKRQNLQLPMQP